MTLDIIEVPEHRLTPALEKAVRGLLRECFPDAFADRAYFKQRPHARLLAMARGAPIGHVGLDHRMISVQRGADAAEPLRMLGLCEVCVSQGFRGAGVASKLLARAEAMAREAGADLLLLFADDHRLYRRNGYTLAGPHPVRFLALHEHASVRVMERDHSAALMVKPLSGPWRGGAIDLMGHLF